MSTLATARNGTATNVLWVGVAILGAIAFDQKNRGEKVHGIASVHGTVGAVTATAYGLAILSVSLKF